MPRPSVQLTTEYQRIAALPRRVLDPIDADAWAEVWSEELRAPEAQRIAACGGREKRHLRTRASLRRWQGQCCAEAAEVLGGFYVLPVGFGKTLLSYVLGMCARRKRVLLILPANLRNKTYADFASYRGEWRTPNPPPRIISREELALEQNKNLLEDFDPDCIIIDESDELANYESAAARRLDRFILARTREECAVFCMSGTPSRNSIMAYWHLLIWCLREDAPVPLNRGEARKWAAAIDQIKNADDTTRMLPGPLGDTRREAVAWFRERLQETPGVVIVDGDSAGDVLLIIRQRLPKECPAIDAAFQKFAVDQEDPDGMPCAAPLDRWRLDGFLGCGLFRRYTKPGPPKEWIDKRRLRGRAFAALCRTVIQNTRNHRDPADTERQVRRHFARAPEDSSGRRVIEQWDEVKDDPYPTEAVWISTATLDTAAAWLRERSEAGIIWCGSVEFARELAKRLRLPYYGREGRDQNGRELHEAPAGKSFVASWNANKKGFNLQPWRRHAVVLPPSSAKWLEQLFGRSHRSLQTGAVTFDLFMTSGGRFDAFESALAEGRFARDSVGPQQKILRSKIERVKAKRTDSNKYRWARAERN